MKKVRQKFVVGAIAASLLIGGGIAGLSSVQAANTDKVTDTSTAVQNTKTVENFWVSDHGKRVGFRKHRNELIVETATLLGIDQKSLMNELKQGKTLAQVAQEKAGLSQEVYLEKLTDALNKQIDALVSSGKITQDQADQRKSSLADHLAQKVQAPIGMGKFFHGGGHGFGFMGENSGLTEILGMTADEIRTELQSGKSLVEIAQQKGITEEQLIQQLKDNMTDQIKKFVEMKRGPIQ